MKNIFLIFPILISILLSWESSKILIPKHKSISDFNIYTGLDILEQSNFKFVEDQNIGLVINHTSVNRYSVHFLNLIIENENINISKIFTPEHGLKGKLSAGEYVNSGYDAINKIDIISLYGKNKKPKPSDLADLDLIIYDIQDIGARYYTYISTMSYMLEACANYNIPILILDRPNPLGGEIVRGPILEEGFESFVGLHPIPIVHGMTSGELAIMINELKWFESDKNANLTIIPSINWQRKEEYNGPLKSWLSPSPNIPDLETAKLYTGLCLLEGTNLSEGRGTFEPFKKIGAPWIISGDEIKFKMDSIFKLGITLYPQKFTPKPIENMSKWPKYENQLCYGFNLELKDEKFDPLKYSVLLINEIKNQYSEDFKFLDSHFIDKLYGSDKLRTIITNDGNIDSLINTWNVDEQEFKKRRAKYLIYN